MMILEDEVVRLGGVPEEGDGEYDCVNCRYWFAEGDDVGSCRRYAPMAILGAEDKVRWANWPLTYLTDSCGEFKGRG